MTIVGLKFRRVTPKIIFFIETKELEFYLATWFDLKNCGHLRTSKCEGNGLFRKKNMVKKYKRKNVLNVLACLCQSKVQRARGRRPEMAPDGAAGDTWASLIVLLNREDDHPLNIANPAEKNVPDQRRKGRAAGIILAFTVCGMGSRSTGAPANTIQWTYVHCNMVYQAVQTTLISVFVFDEKLEIAVRVNSTSVYCTP